MAAQTITPGVRTAKQARFAFLKTVFERKCFRKSLWKYRAELSARAFLQGIGNFPKLCRTFALLEEKPD
jgi:hypothetical protein